MCFGLFPVQQGHLYIIDVSQAVDLDHPHALDFLREDCVHVSVRISICYSLLLSFHLPIKHKMNQFVILTSALRI